MTVKIRVFGTKEECERVAEELKKIASVRTVSGFYPNRGNTIEGRVYITIDFNN